MSSNVPSMTVNRSRDDGFTWTVPTLMPHALATLASSFLRTEPLRGSGSIVAVNCRIFSVCTGDPSRKGLGVPLAPAEWRWFGMFTSDANLFAVGDYHNYRPHTYDPTVGSDGAYQNVDTSHGSANEEFVSLLKSSLLIAAIPPSSPYFPTLPHPK